jgi:hypothetical protein
MPPKNRTRGRTKNMDRIERFTLLLACLLACLLVCFLIDGDDLLSSILCFSALHTSKSFLLLMVIRAEIIDWLVHLTD